MAFMDVSPRARLFGAGARPASRRPSAALSRPRLEALEDRSLPSAAGGISVMTYNLNEGTDFIPLLSAARPQDVPAAVTQTFSQVASSNIPDRAMALARVIARALHPQPALRYPSCQALMLELQQAYRGSRVVRRIVRA